MSAPSALSVTRQIASLVAAVLWPLSCHDRSLRLQMLFLTLLVLLPLLFPPEFWGCCNKQSCRHLLLRSPPLGPGCCFLRWKAAGVSCYSRHRTAPVRPPAPLWTTTFTINRCLDYRYSHEHRWQTSWEDASESLHRIYLRSYLRLTNIHRRKPFMRASTTTTTTSASPCCLSLWLVEVLFSL